ncbi:ribonuclease T2-like [Planococcus citri]|uniref:ribonuclease T2-like n=1 Tax=Planococcus citri TaxID=170843 RepID=UPI0031F7FE94
MNSFVDKENSFALYVFWGLVVTLLAIRVIKYLSYKHETFEVDYLVLAVTWPISICSSFKKERNCAHKCDLSEDNWIIHGFWPHQNLGNHKQQISYYCPSSPFNHTELEPIRNLMEEYWPTKKSCWNNSQLWEHEWSKHGTCALQLKPLSSQLKYFQRTLELYKEYDVTKALNDCNIRPNDLLLYRKDDIVDCFVNHFKKSPRLSCKQSNKKFLTEVMLCFDKELVLQDCKTFPALNKDNCKGALILAYPAQI